MALEEQKKTSRNSGSKTKEAVVIANYGDPGLDEDSHFDILSRFLICVLESKDRVLTADKWMNHLIIVKRPANLWIKAEGSIAANPVDQKRSDSTGNISIGLASNYSTKGISRINFPYSLGDVIRVRELPSISTPALDPDFFKSRFETWDSSVSSYIGGHTEGSTLPYYAGDSNENKRNGIKTKTIFPALPTEPYDGSYNIKLMKDQYEAFLLKTAATNMVDKFIALFEGTCEKTNFYSANGGYYFSKFGTKTSVLFSMAKYEDVNKDERERSSVSECIPLVVATPNTFPTPKVRSAGLINYNPSYSPVGV